MRGKLRHDIRSVEELLAGSCCIRATRELALSSCNQEGRAATRAEQSGEERDQLV